VNPRVREAFTQHEIQTVKEMGWGGITNGKLMALAQQSFDIFVTLDQNLEHQQNLAKLRFGIVVIAVPDNNIKYLKPLFPDLLKAAESIGPGQIIHIVSPDLRLDRRGRPVT
jgi:hypothetical protein